MIEISNTIMTEPVSDRELEILRLIAQGKTNRDIARKLVLSPETIKWHNKRAFSKLSASNRTEAVAKARSLGLLSRKETDYPKTRTFPARLPAELSSFVGREKEMEALLMLLKKARLITLTGPGGIGKTRLALRAAHEAGAHFTEAAFVSLAVLSDPAQVAHRIIEALGVIERRGSTAVNALKRYLRDRKMLLVLDNFEHLLSAAPLIAELLTAAPNLQVIATSREALRLSGEFEFSVPPLPVPDANQGATAAAYTTFASVLLFVQRARAVSNSFELTEENAAVVGALCAQLDGLPLAIELAAARIKLFTPQQLLERLDDRLNLLTAGSRDLPPRQSTLRNTIGWSYDLLDRDEQLLFRRLAVFADGCSLAAVESVCGAGLHINVVDGLYSLVSKSLLITVEDADDLRFIMLQTIHEFALEQLEQSGEMAQLRDRHLRNFQDLIVAMAPGFRHHGQLILMQQADREFANLQAAYDWALDSEDIAAAAQILSAADYYLIYSQNIAQGYRWLNDLLPHMEHLPEKIQLRALLAAGRICCNSGAPAQGKQMTQEGLALAGKLGDRRMRAWLLVELSIISISLMEDVRNVIIPLCEESLGIFRELNDSAGMAFAMNVLGEIWREADDYECAEQAYAESIALCRENGEMFREMMLLSNLSFVAYNQGKYEQAREYAEDHLRKMHTVNLKKPCDCLSLAVLAGPLAQLGQLEKATRLLAASGLLMDEMGARFQHADASEIEKYAADIRSQLDQAEFDAAWSEGRSMTLEQALSYALDEQRASSP